MAKALNSAAIATWVPNASYATGTFTIPSNALVPSLAGASGATVSNDVRQFLMGLLDVAYTQYANDMVETGTAVSGTDYPSSITISRAVLNDKVQFVVSINTTGSVALPTYA